MEWYLYFSTVCVHQTKLADGRGESWGLLEISVFLSPFLPLSPSTFPLFLFLPPSPIPPSLSFSHSFPLTYVGFILWFLSGNIETIETCFCFSSSLGAEPFHLWFSQFPSKLNIKQICLLTADPRSGRARGPPPGGGELSRQRWRGDRMEPALGPWGRPKVVSLPSRQPNSQESSNGALLDGILVEIPFLPEGERLTNWFCLPFRWT